MKIESVIFDFDDTLVATFESRITILKAAASRLGHRITSKDLLMHWGKPFDQLIKGVAPSINYEEFYYVYKKAMLEHQPVVLPGVYSYFNKLIKSKIPIFVVSSGSRELVIQDLQEAELWLKITRLWAFEDTTYHKPDPRTLNPVLQYLQNNGSNTSKALYVGDSIMDYDIAKANGIVFFGVLTGQNNKRDFLQKGAMVEQIGATMEDVINCENLCIHS